MQQARCTVERLDRPSAYYANKSNKRRRTDNSYRGDSQQRDGGDDDERQQQPPAAEPDEADPLKDATTLYVGNL